MSFLWKLLGFSSQESKESQRKIDGNPPEISPFDNIQTNISPFQINSTKSSKFLNTGCQPENTISNYVNTETETDLQIPVNYQNQFLEISKEIVNSALKTKQNTVKQSIHIEPVVTQVKPLIPISTISTSTEENAKEKQNLTNFFFNDNQEETETKASEPQTEVEHPVKVTIKEERTPEPPKPKEIPQPTKIIQQKPIEKKKGFASTNFQKKVKIEDDEDGEAPPSQELSFSLGDFSIDGGMKSTSSLSSNKTDISKITQSNIADNTTQSSQPTEQPRTIERRSSMKQNFPAVINTDFSRRNSIRDGFSFSPSDSSSYSKPRGRGSYTPRARGSYSSRGRGRGSHMAPRRSTSDDDSDLSSSN